MFLQMISQISSITKFSNNIAIFVVFDNIIAFHNVLMWKGSQCLNFPIQHILGSTITDSPHVDHLNSHILF